MKKWFVASIVYIVAIAVAFAAPVSEGYDSASWRLLVGQPAAILAFFLTAWVMHKVTKPKNQ